MVKESHSDFKRNPKKIFFAYEGRRDGQCNDNVDSITHAIQDYNSRQNQYKAESWEDFKKTAVINTDILRAINEADVFVADMTHFNHNVLFELGYAIARDRKVLIFLNKRVAGAEARYKNFILKAIKFNELVNFKSIVSALSAESFQNGLLSTLVNTDNIDINSADIFHIQSSNPTDAALQLTEDINVIKELYSCHVVNADPNEIPYRPLDWYFTSVFISKYVVIHMLGKNYDDLKNENAKNSFFAGLALGLNKQVLLVAPYTFPAPLDYDDILIQYSSAKDCVDRVIDWLERRLSVPALQPTPSLCVSSEISRYDERQTNLLKLGIGEVDATDEQAALGAYFIETASYHTAQNHSKSIIIGRKGSGKSAIYYRLLNDYAFDKHNYIISLRPESEELLHDVEISKLYDSPASKKSFFLSVWKFVLLSRLIKSINDKLLEKNGTDYSDQELELMEFVKKNESRIRLNFFGVMHDIAKKLREDSKLVSPKVLEEMYNDFLSPLIHVVKAYFSSASVKYVKIIVMADNLDKTWDAKHELDIQSEMLLTLFEMEISLKNLLIDKRGLSLDVREIIFLRKDIFDYIKGVYLEPDKLEPLIHEIDWNDYPIKLKELINTRIQLILGLKDISESETIWAQYFGFTSKAHPFDVIENNVTRRPRDIIFILNALFASAVNNNRIKVTDEDLNRAIRAYRKFLTANLTAETNSKYSGISSFLTKLVDADLSGIEYADIEKSLKETGFSEEKIQNLIEDLFELGHLKADTDDGAKILNYPDFKKELSKRINFFFKKKIKLFFIIRKE